MRVCFCATWPPPSKPPALSTPFGVLSPRFSVSIGPSRRRHARIHAARMNTTRTSADVGAEPTTTELSPSPVLRVERWTEVVDRVGLCRQRIHALIRANKFPAPIRLHAHLSGFFAQEVDAYLLSRPRATESAPEKGDAVLPGLRALVRRRQHASTKNANASSRNSRRSNPAQGMSQGYNANDKPR